MIRVFRPLARSPRSGLIGLLGIVPLGLVFLLAMHTTGWKALAPGRQGPPHLLPGMTVEAAPVPRHGLIVTSLQSNSQAATTGIAVGDGISAIDGQFVATLDQAVRYLHNDRRATVVLRVIHNRRARAVTLERAETWAWATSCC